MIDIFRLYPQQIIIFVLLAHLSSKLASPSPRKVEGLLGEKCRGSFQCEINQWCYHNKCDLPCAKLDCEYHSPPDGVCVVRDHQPVCKTPTDLEDETAIRVNGGCVTSEDCSEDEMCIYATCYDACQQLNCTAVEDDAECEVINHHPICKPKPEEKEEMPSVLVGKGGECTDSLECETKLTCHAKKCRDPCEGEWCHVFNLAEPPSYYGPEMKERWHKLKAYDWKCVVFNHVAECIITNPRYHSTEEVDA